MSEVVTLCLQDISEPFDMDEVVELKFEVHSTEDANGELYLRVPAHRARQYQVYDMFAAQLHKLD